jgi:FG-GAP-like repeat/FG-GAP repeat
VKKLLVVATLLVLSGSLGAAALLASSAPSFAPARSYSTGRAPVSVAIGDLNGDGKPDLASANRVAHTVSVLLNRGEGSFQARLDYPTVGADSVAIGDLNCDGKPDLATANESGAVSVLLNTGDGGFAARRDYGTDFEPRSVAISDVNGDGRPDLVTANEGLAAITVNPASPASPCF